MAYTRVNWQNSPSHATPLSAENLNVMDEGIYDLDATVTDLKEDLAQIDEFEIYVSGTSLVINSNLTDGNEVSY